MNRLILSNISAIVLISWLTYINVNSFFCVLLDALPIMVYFQRDFQLEDRERSTFDDYFDFVESMSDTQFHEDFRMSKMTFALLHQKLITIEAFQFKSRGKPSVNSEKCLLIAIWVLATPDSYRSIARRFAVSKSTVALCICRVIRALLTTVCRIAIKHPRNEEERVETAAKFEESAGMKKVLGAIDGCHIKILAPKQNKDCYYDRKCNYSLTLQEVCDADLFFTDVDVWWPGNVHDARVFKTSDVYPIGYQICRNNYYFIGDSAYPLKMWLMRPYKQTHTLNAKQKTYNKALSKTRQVIERAFGRLKIKFRRLLCLHMLNIKDYVEAIVTCCSLYNIYLASEDHVRSLIFGEEEVDVDAELHDLEEDPFETPNEKRKFIENALCNLHLNNLNNE